MILLASVLLALLMGFAVQRGGTCLVAALEEVVQRRRWARFRALLETSLWVLGGFVLLRALDHLPMVPMGFLLHWHAALGGALLGVGAFLNGGCAFGVVARIGSGQWAWLATPRKKPRAYLPCKKLRKVTRKAWGAPMTGPSMGASVKAGIPRPDRPAAPPGRR